MRIAWPTSGGQNSSGAPKVEPVLSAHRENRLLKSPANRFSHVRDLFRILICDVVDFPNVFRFEEQLARKTSRVSSLAVVILNAASRVKQFCEVSLDQQKITSPHRGMTFVVAKKDSIPANELFVES